jgi:hypothetical protein
MHLTPIFATLLATLSFSSISTAADQLNRNVIRVSLERKSFVTHLPAGPSPNHNSRDLATRANNAAGYVNRDFLKTHVASVAM